jgi:lysophospholipase L1-like esterase
LSFQAGRFRDLAVLLAALAALVPGTALAGDPKCAAPSDLVRFQAPLPKLAHEAAEGQLVIVAIGSSTTAGTGASGPAAGYPERLEGELERRLPGLTIEVINKGVGGQNAVDMLARFDSDVLAERPALVIWQTGSNDVMHNIPVRQFKQTLTDGVARLHAAGVDVVLMDLQYWPKAEDLAHYGDYLQAMAEVARDEGVPLLRRSALMRHWLVSGQFPPDALLSADRFHMADLSYGCLADVLAQALDASIRGPRASAAAH